MRRIYNNVPDCEGSESITQSRIVKRNVSLTMSRIVKEANL